MNKKSKSAQINVLKAELCIEYMKMRLKPPKTIEETIFSAVYLRLLIFQIQVIASQPIYPKGIAIVGNSDKKEVILPNDRRNR